MSSMPPGSPPSRRSPSATAEDDRGNELLIDADPNPPSYDDSADSYNFDDIDGEHNDHDDLPPMPSPWGNPTKSAFDSAAMTETSSHMDTTTDLGAEDSGEDEKEAAAAAPWYASRRNLLILIVFLLLLIGLSIGIGVGVGTNNKRSRASTSPGEVSSDPTDPIEPTEPIDQDSGDGEPAEKITTSPSGSPTDSPTTSPTFEPRPTDITVGVYYYPWHGDTFHNGGGYLRRDLQPPQAPQLGEYDDRDPAVVAQHMAWSRQANVNLWVTSWWGPNRLEDITTRDVILPHPDISDLKIALHWETTGRIRSIDDYSTHIVRSDIEYMCKTYWDHPNYYTINGRPVIFIYISRYLKGIGKLMETLVIMRSTADRCGKQVYIVGDHVFRSAPPEEERYIPFDLFDAVTNYDVYGSMPNDDLHVGPEKVDMYYDEQAKWRKQAAAQDCGFIVTAAPGYNDRAIRPQNDHHALSRRLTPDSDPGTLFTYALSKAVPLVDPIRADKLIMINSFNEWHEDTQIEPVAISAAAGVGVDSVKENADVTFVIDPNGDHGVDVDHTTMPPELTNGVDYTGYGELYLNILREGTTGWYETVNGLQKLD